MATSLFEEEKVPVYEYVRDTELARFMYPDYVKMKDGTLQIIVGYEYVDNSFNGLFKRVYSKHLDKFIPQNNVLLKKVKGRKK
jgi:hypothetical protein